MHGNNRASKNCCCGAKERKQMRHAPLHARAIKNSEADYSPSPEWPEACHGNEWRGEPSEALAPVLSILRSSLATEDGRSSLLRRMERRAEGYGEFRHPYQDAPRLAAGRLHLRDSAALRYWSHASIFCLSSPAFFRHFL